MLLLSHLNLLQNSFPNPKFLTSIIKLSIINLALSLKVL